MVDYYELQKNKKQEMSTLFKRMTDDNELITNVNYVMKDAQDKAIKNVINVTGNRPMVFASFVEAALNRADEKLYVESDDEKIDTSEIENAIKRIFSQTNSQRRKKGLFSIESYIDQQNCRRGRSIARLITNENEDGTLDIEITPWDTRYVTYEMGTDGLGWGAFEMIKTKEMVESEDWAIEKGFTPSGKLANEVDIWTPEGNLIYVDGQLVNEQPHEFGYTPLCLQIVPIGSMLADEGNIKYEGESIFFLIRHLIPEFNRLVSILQTHNMRSVKSAMQQVLDAGGTPSDYEEVTAMGAVTATNVVGGIHPIHYEDVKQSAILILQQISKEIDDGSLSPIMLGDLPGPMSAVALVQIEQGQGQVFMPRLGARGLLKQQLAEMAINQILQTGTSSVMLGTKGHKKLFKTSKLEGEYEIVFSYANKSPETDFARLTMAKQYKDVLDEETILTDILKRDDPEGDLNRIRRERLRAISPTLQIYDGLMSLSELYEDGDESIASEIDIVEAELGVNLDSIKAGILPQATQPKGGETTPPLQAITNQGQTSNQKAADLIRTPATEVPTP